MDEYYLVKNCECDSQGSGPRSIPIYEDDKIIAYAYAKKACDKCDSPFVYPRIGIYVDEFKFNTKNEVQYK